MYEQHFFDQAMMLIERDHIESAMSLLANKLHIAAADPQSWPEVRRTYREHPLSRVLLEDPYTRRCYEKPRGYAGDAVLIDMIYDRVLPSEASEIGARAFAHSTLFPVANAVRQRRDYARERLEGALADGQRVLCLAAGHFREADHLDQDQLAQIVAVDQDEQSLDVIRKRHGDAIELYCANVFSYLRTAMNRGEKFDFIYTLGLTDYLDDRAMHLMHKMVRALLKPGGTFLLANFLPHHLAMGWMDAVMDWHLIYREADELLAFAEANQFTPTTWIDRTGSIAWCEMQAS